MCGCRFRLVTAHAEVIMKQLIQWTGLLILCTTILWSQENGPYSEVRIQVGGPAEWHRLVNGGWQPDHVIRGKGFVDAVVSADELQLLRGLGASLEVLVPDVEAAYDARPKLSATESDDLERRMRETYGISGFGFGSMGGFYTYQEVIRQLDTMALLYPDLISVRDSIGASIEGRAIWAVKISDNPAIHEGEPEVLYTGLHHAREPEGMMAVIYFMYYLLENYGTDPEVTYLVNERQMYFVPVVNPDGYVRNQTTNPNGGGNWRKNRRLNAGGSYGVDLNRNYGYMWGYDNIGSSNNPSSDTYRGTAAFSEPEIQAMRDFCLGHAFKLALNFHSYGNLLIYPWGYIASFLTPDSSTFIDYTTDMTQFNQYVHGTGDETVGYVTNGDSDDWMYGEQIIKAKILSMTPEVGSSFWPPMNQIFPIADENLYPNLFLAWAAGPFLKVGDCTFSQETFQPGDTGSVRFALESKGQSPVSGSIRWTTASVWLTLMDSTASVELPAVTGVDTVDLSFVVSPDAIGPVALESVLQISVAGQVVATQPLVVRVGMPLVVLSNDAENGLTGWTATGTWNTTTSHYHSPGHSFTESPSGNYPANADYRLTMTSGIDFTNQSAVAISYWERYVTEADYDYCLVEYSTDGGTTWKSLRRVSGSNPAWTLRTLNVADATGEGDVRFRFRLTSDQSLQYDGWYVDDIAVSAYPREPVVGIPSGARIIRRPFLAQNYPNPFNPSTTVRYEVPVASRVRLGIYNVLGQRVKTLVEAKKLAGWHDVVWDGTNDADQRVASGIYICRLESSGLTASRKMVFIK